MQAFNPYLPSWEYIPDGEPHVFGDRVYVYGSHDRFRGHAYCLNDYVCWSAPVDDLADWRYEGVIFKKTDDPDNADGEGCLFAPDVTRGPDGRYYLYYVLSNRGYVSVAVCDTPAGRYQFLGNVRYAGRHAPGRAGGRRAAVRPRRADRGRPHLHVHRLLRPRRRQPHRPDDDRAGPGHAHRRGGPGDLMPSQPYAKGSGLRGPRVLRGALHPQVRRHVLLRVFLRRDARAVLCHRRRSARALHLRRRAGQQLRSAHRQLQARGQAHVLRREQPRRAGEDRG